LPQEQAHKSEPSREYRLAETESKVYGYHDHANWVETLVLAIQTFVSILESRLWSPVEKAVSLTSQSFSSGQFSLCAASKTLDSFEEIPISTLDMNSEFEFWPSILVPKWETPAGCRVQSFE
jgi:hypothetical protein